MATMIQVTFGTTVKSEKKIVSSDTTIQAFAEENGLITAGSTLNLNGVAVKDTGKTFESALPAGAVTCMLFSVVNAKNA